MRKLHSSVTALRCALDAASLRAAEDAFNWSLSNPGSFLQNVEATFHQDVSHPESVSQYRAFLGAPALSRIAQTIWGPGRAWYMFEQIFLKEGAQTRRTPWRQDSTYFSVAGERVAVLWINFDPVRTGDSLEFVRGSHRGPTYNGTAFDPDVETTPAFETDMLPRLPDIQANRDD
jgi:ectoine hydroxylase-related dioxygenase (phytanoyl-CoA dioxygenase family)